MIRFIRARNTEILPYLEPHLVEDPDFTKEGFLEYLGQLLVHDQKHLFIITAWTENDELAGFLIAYAPPGMVFTFVYQAWLNGKLASPEIGRLALARLKAWTDSLGRTRILAETRRNPEAFFRKWGFQEVSKTLELNLYEDEEKAHERWIKDGQHAESEPEGRGREDQQLPEGEDRTGSGTVQGSAGSGPDATVRQDSTGSPELQRELSDAGSDSGDSERPERETRSDSGPENDSQVL